MALLTKAEVLARVALHRTARNIRALARIITAVTATIQVNKPYKPRRLKMDFEHIQKRREDRKMRRNPMWKAHQKIVRRKYMQKFGRFLKKRAERRREIRKQRGLD